MSSTLMAENHFTQIELIDRALFGYNRDEDGRHVSGAMDRIEALFERMLVIERKMAQRDAIDSWCVRISAALLVVIAYKLTVIDVSRFLGH